MRVSAAQLVIAAGLVAARCVHADPAHDSVNERNAKADQLFEEGRKLFKEHRYVEAFDLFAQSDAHVWQLREPGSLRAAETPAGARVEAL
jgi:outer membrane protein assembly factor BamD (BamD/ComL family)